MKNNKVPISSENLIQGVGLALTVLIFSLTALAVIQLKENAINEWSKELENLTLVTADHAYQTIFSAEVALESIDDLVDQQKLVDASAFQKFASKKETHQLLSDRQVANPIIDVISLVDIKGNVVNFTRSYPPPPINLSDRDYYDWHLKHNSDNNFYSLPVKNRGNGKWVFYISKRVNNPRGDLIGLILVGVSVEVFSKIYERLGKNLGEGASVSLYRRDFTLLTRWPLKDQLIGQKNYSSATKQIIEDQQLSHGVMITHGPRLTENNEIIKRMVATRTLSKYPFLVTIVATEDLYLSAWRKSTLWISVTALLSVVIVLTLIKLLSSANGKISKELSERVEAQNQLFVAHQDLERRIQDRTRELREQVTQKEIAQENLAEINSRIAKISHQAGMAEVANSMLHNIGNVLNSLNVSIAVLRTQLNRSPLVQFPEVIQLIEKNKTNLSDYLTRDPAGQHVIELLKLLSEQAVLEHQNFMNETNQIYASVQHVNEIIDKQKSYSNRLGVIETFNVLALINEALSFYQESLDGLGVSVITDIPEELAWVADKNKITQIIINLVVNAKDSMALCEIGRGQLNISAYVSHQDSKLVIRITDNGVGIDPETIKNIFNYGFTTKTTGHGFGLHGSALAAKEMAGDLSVHSDGLGAGATFILTVPKHGAV